MNSHYQNILILPGNIYYLIKWKTKTTTLSVQKNRRSNIKIVEMGIRNVRPCLIVLAKMINRN